MKGYRDLKHTKIDTDRVKRRGFPETIFCEGKTLDQIVDIFNAMKSHGSNVLMTRASQEVFKSLHYLDGRTVYNQQGRVIALEQKPLKKVGLVYVVTAGTSDIPVAEEAVSTLEVFGNNTKKIYDVGVAGIHRLFSYEKELRKANCIIAVAGMDGAMPSVIAGRVNVPVIGVPTSVGYGVCDNGWTALRAMLASCAEGLSVVNIDGGFKGATVASMINRAQHKV